MDLHQENPPRQSHSLIAESLIHKKNCEPYHKNIINQIILVKKDQLTFSFTFFYHILY